MHFIIHKHFVKEVNGPKEANIKAEASAEFVFAVWVHEWKEDDKFESVANELG